MDEYGMKSVLQIIEAGQSIKRIASFMEQEHAIKFADSLLDTTFKGQFLMITQYDKIVYIKQGLKRG